jgi:hypothetical protein
MMYLHRAPLHVEDPFLADQIYDLMEEYGADCGLSEGWWLSEADEEEILLHIDNEC